MGNPGEPPAYTGQPAGYPNLSYPGAAPPVVTILPSPVLGPGPTRLTCPHCQTQVESTVEYQSNSRTHLFALLLCLICPFGCCLIPYCTNSCMSATHTCPTCKQSLGTYLQ